MEYFIAQGVATGMAYTVDWLNHRGKKTEIRRETDRVKAAASNQINETVASLRAQALETYRTNKFSK